MKKQKIPINEGVVGENLVSPTIFLHFVSKNSFFVPAMPPQKMLINITPVYHLQTYHFDRHHSYKPDLPFDTRFVENRDTYHIQI